MKHDRRPLVMHVVHHLVMGGMENGLINLINRLPEDRFRHAVVCIEDYSDFAKRLRRSDVELVPLYRSRVGTWGIRRRIYRLCRQLRPSILHSRNMSGLDAILPARLAGVPRCIHGEHGWDVHDLHGDAWKPALQRRLHRPLVDRYITVSQHLQRYLIERVGIAAARTRQIYNGVDTERFTPATPADRNASAGRLVIGTVGRIQRVKDQATLLKAFSQSLQTTPRTRKIRLAIVGDGPLLPELRNLAQALGVAEHVDFPGAVGNVPDVLRSMDLFVLPSLSEGISNTILEAMATGVPVVATKVGGNVELVDDGCTGRLFEPGDVTALSALIGEYASDSSLRHDQGRHAREVAVDKFGLDRMVRNYEAVYDELRVETRAG